MIRQLKPWAYGPFELLLNAELHYRVGEDFDRRIAMVGFDNAIEVAITTYLGLHPIQRGGREYTRGEVEQCLRSYHSKVEFFFHECTARHVTAAGQHDEIVWFHSVRNGQYHGGGANVPQRRELDGVRAAALEVFAILFDAQDVAELLDGHVAAKAGPQPAPRTDEDDRVIDDEYGMISVAGKREYASDVLYALDPERYREVALQLLESTGQQEETP
ncbi:hypothetical protein FHT12_002993 [Xanthomonas campestris]|uniref:hypothetical protein n=1 Tax=Xanthomonas euroxanthea TaxID=2259622 RepID=UPI000CEE2EFA|nr:hypothetical protein [Xanthomonas euroxanthea]NIJ94296.1 hypothetical protein [Xanthomonas euroxanthea]PPT32869.1 hypothetical protein XaCFBP7622_03445 [Xanthomonas arboricola]